MTDDRPKKALRVIAPPEFGDIVADAVCPQCGCVGCVRMSPFQWGGKQHKQWHCPCCSHQWIERGDTEAHAFEDFPFFCPHCKAPQAHDVYQSPAVRVRFCNNCEQSWTEPPRQPR